MTLPLLTSPTLAAAGFAHGFTTRRGGVSPPPYDTLDFAMLRDAASLRENQRRLAEALGYDASRLYQATQVHGRAVVVAEGDPVALAKREADALVASRAGVAIAVRVADCVPVLVADPGTGRVAAMHAGWRGVEARVVDAGVEALHGDPSRMVAAIGPSIGPCCFEVGADVAERITAATGVDVVARRDEARGKAYVDLRRGVRAQLRRLGLADASIDDVPGCTRCDAERFYSFRRDGDASGRLVGVIVAR